MLNQHFTILDKIQAMREHQKEWLRKYGGEIKPERTVQKKHYVDFSEQKKEEIDNWLGDLL